MADKSKIAGQSLGKKAADLWSKYSYIFVFIIILVVYAFTISANGNRFNPGHISGILSSQNTVIVGTMTASWTYYAAEDNTTVIYGTKGELRLYDDPKYSVQQINADGTRIDYQIDQIQTNDNQTASGIIDLFKEKILDSVTISKRYMDQFVI